MKSLILSIFTITLFLGIQSCSSSRSISEPSIVTTQLGPAPRIEYASDVKLFFEGEDLPLIHTHIATLKLTGRSGMSEKLIWNYFRDQALKMHANAIINIKSNTLTQRSDYKESDGSIRIKENYVTELSGIAIYSEEIQNEWQNEYASAYNDEIQNYRNEQLEKNKPSVGGTILAGAVLLVYYALIED